MDFRLSPAWGAMNAGMCSEFGKSSKKTARSNRQRSWLESRRASDSGRAGGVEYEPPNHVHVVVS